MQLGDQGHSHPVEAIAGSKAVDQPVLGAQQLCAASQACDDPRHHEAKEDILFHRKAVELCRSHIQAHRPELEALGGVEQEVVHQQPHHKGDHKGGGGPEAK